MTNDSCLCPTSEREGVIVALSVSVKTGIPKSNVDCAEFIVDHGIKGDAHAQNWHRQISLLAKESIDKMKAAGLPNLRSGDFAENITTENIQLVSLPLGTKITLGKEVVIEITQIGKECHSRCAIYYSAGDCVMPKEGIFAKVLRGGTVKVGDAIKVVKGIEVVE